MRRALQRLGILVGEWTIEAEFPSEPSPGVVGRAVFEWILGGEFLAQRVMVPHPDAPDSYAVYSVDRQGGGYTQHYFDSRGVVRLYAMTLEGAAWTMTREAADFTPLDFSQRFTATVSEEGNTIRGRWETSRDGAEWTHDFDLIYRRVGEGRDG